MQVKTELCSNSVYQIHAGNSSIWSTPWSPIWNNIHDHLILPITTNPLPSKVSDLWILGSQTWDTSSPSPLLNKPLKLSLPSNPLLATTQIFFVGHLQRMACALLKTFTDTFLSRTRSLFPFKAPEVFT